MVNFNTTEKAVHVINVKMKMYKIADSKCTILASRF